MDGTVPAIDLSNPEYQALVDDQSMKAWISGGMPGTQMPAFAISSGGTLTDQQIDAIVRGMRKEWLQAGRSRRPEPPPYAQVEAGDARPRLNRITTRIAHRATRRRSSKSLVRITWLWSAIKRCAASWLLAALT